VEKREGLLKKVWLGAERVSQMYYRLLVVVSNDEVKGGGYIAEGLDIRRINVGEKLGEELMDVPAKRRPLKVAGLLENLLDIVENDRLMLDHIEILFEESLKVEPLTLLRSVSRRRLVVVMWRGEIEAGNLVYGFPGHPEYRSYPARDVALVHFPE
jgi:ATP-dependent helicase/nuclease subunit A